MRKRAAFLAVAGTVAAVAAAMEAARSHATAPAVRPTSVQLLGHASPGGGYSGDVFAHRGFAYLSSWRGRECPSQGVRVYDVRNPRQPRRIAAFADAASDPSVAGTWTEKTIVQRVAAQSERATSP